jgi:hypothetical protein
MSNFTETRHPSVEPKKNISSRMSSLAEAKHPSVEPQHSVLGDYTMNQTIKASNSKTMKNVEMFFIGSTDGCLVSVKFDIREDMFFFGSTDGCLVSVKFDIREDMFFPVNMEAKYM